MPEDLPDLTPKQFAFVQGILAGKTATDAYRAAYDTDDMLTETVWAEASRLRADRKVSTWLEASKKHALTEATYGLQEHVQDLLEARDLCKKHENIGAYVKATELLGRASGVYVERIQTDASEQDIVKLLMLLGQPGRELAASLGVDLPSDDGTPATKH